MTCPGAPGRVAAVVALAAALAPSAALPARARGGDLPQTCIASWYGAPEDRPGRRTTAGGEPFDPQAMTAASRDLPFGTVVRVSNAVTSAAVTVRVNDRGPWAAGRCIDLTRAAFGAIADLDQGLVRVNITVPRTVVFLPRR
ncbi:septal ring lytic transglycosylase RlpA family protein [Streptomyces sp. NPDC008001]|uniref:septal ring lytic transglycosylase RlpA family protein n=1 Tax=Streptomyces sp. NPDC008001 TaxID=3364804 RepID=UPI0036F149FD